jgi:hypothetical protein
VKIHRRKRICVFVIIIIYLGGRMAQWVRSLDLTTHASLSPIRRVFKPGFVNYKKGALDSHAQPQVIKFSLYMYLYLVSWISCLNKQNTGKKANYVTSSIFLYSVTYICLSYVYAKSIYIFFKLGMTLNLNWNT